MESGLESSAHCPCGSGLSYGGCCSRYHNGSELAPTAEALMRARYSAYVVCDIDYLAQTIPLIQRKGFDRNFAKAWAKQSEWLGLEILSTRQGGVDDSQGIVEFKATFRQNGTDYVHHEIGTFKKAGSRWQFVDGKIVPPDSDSEQVPNISRNAACPCGSGKKFKNCCGK